jgi:hypothetical protein
VIRKRHRLYAVYFGHRLRHSLVEREGACGIVVAGRRHDAKGDKVPSVEARFHLLEPPEAPDQETGPNQKDQRQRNLGDNQGRAEPHFAAATSGSRSSLTQRPGEIEVG